MSSMNNGRDVLETVIQEALGISKPPYVVKRHTYIASTHGASVSKMVNDLVNEWVPLTLKVRGAPSMSAFVSQLAWGVYSQPKGEITVWIDDCDSLFISQENANIMKGALDEDRNVLSYNRDMSTQINKFLNSTNAHGVRQGAALKHFQDPIELGIKIPTDRMRFLITGFKPLTSCAELRGKPYNSKRMAEAAIRDRVTYFDATDIA